MHEARPDQLRNRPPAGVLGIAAIGVAAQHEDQLVHRELDGMFIEEKRQNSALRLSVLPRRGRGMHDARPVGFSAAMGSPLSLWSGSRLALARRREPLLLESRKYHRCRSFPDTCDLFVADDFCDSGAMQASCLANVPERQAGFLRLSECFASLLTCRSSIALELRLGGFDRPECLLAFLDPCHAEQPKS